MIAAVRVKCGVFFQLAVYPGAQRCCGQGTDQQVNGGDADLDYGKELVRILDQFEHHTGTGIAFIVGVVQPGFAHG